MNESDRKEVAFIVEKMLEVQRVIALFTMEKYKEARRIEEIVKCDNCGRSLNRDIGTFCNECFQAMPDDNLFTMFKAIADKNLIGKFLRRYEKELASSHST